jgi:hypothetical protein
VQVRVADHDALYDYGVIVIPALHTQSAIGRADMSHSRKDEDRPAIARIEHPLGYVTVGRLREIHALRIHARQIMADLIRVNALSVCSGGQINA